MRHLGFLLLFAVVLVPAATADEIYIPGNDPTKGSGNAWPWSASASRSEWRYQLLFTAAQLTNKAGVIRAIAFAPQSSGAHRSSKFEMTMSHTSSNVLVSTWANNLPFPTVVHPEAPLTWNPVKDQWSPITLPKPFVYDGTSNLVVDIRYFGGAMSGGFSGSCHSDSGWNATILRSWDNRPGAYTGTTALSANRNLGLITRLTIDGTTVMGSGTPRPGGQIDLNLSSPLDPGRLYQVGTSLGTGPTLIGTRKINLSLDDLLVASVGGFLPSVFVNYAGQLDATGKARAKINVPNDNRLVGVNLHSAFVTVNAAAPQGVQSISNTFSFRVSP